MSRLRHAAAIIWSCDRPLPAAGRHCGAVNGADIPLDQRRSGYADLGRDSKAMQDDDTINPGDALGARWRSAVEPEGRRRQPRLRRLPRDATVSMKGVAARYPAFSPARNGPVNLEQRINLCRSEHQQAPPLPFESRELLALTAYVGRAVARHGDRAAETMIGSRLSSRPAASCSTGGIGQIDMSCAQCHDDNWGKKLAGSLIPQAHPTGYPIYRLEWQGLGSLQRRLRNCMTGLRAEAYDYGAPENVNLELFLMWRARGMQIETPAVRP